jgi:hypothetical protein
MHLPGNKEITFRYNPVKTRHKQVKTKTGLKKAGFTIAPYRPSDHSQAAALSIRCLF